MRKYSPMASNIQPDRRLTLAIHSPDPGKEERSPANDPKTISRVPMPSEKTNNRLIPKIAFCRVETYDKSTERTGAVHGPTTSPEAAPTRKLPSAPLFFSSGCSLIKNSGVFQGSDRTPNMDNPISMHTLARKK